MTPLAGWLRKHDEFLKLMETSAEAGRTSVRALRRILTNPSFTPTLDEFAASRRKDKEITKEIGQLLCCRSLTVLERNDIEALSGALYRIPKNVEKFAERYILTAPQLRTMDFSQQTALLEAATETVVSMIQGLRAATSPEALAKLNERLQQIEGDADKLMLQLLRTLYGAEHPPLKAIILKDLYELLEAGLDRCRDAGNVIFHIALRQSSFRNLGHSFLSFSLAVWSKVSPGQRVSSAAAALPSVKAVCK
jgi:uncharacterized protein